MKFFNRPHTASTEKQNSYGAHRTHRIKAKMKIICFFLFYHFEFSIAASITCREWKTECINWSRVHISIHLYAISCLHKWAAIRIGISQIDFAQLHECSIRLENKAKEKNKKKQNVLIIWVFVSISASFGLQKFVEQPKYTEVNPGEDALLTCKIIDKRGSCSWQKDNKVCVYTVHRVRKMGVIMPHYHILSTNT